MHTIVGQGQLDEILSARPEERRQFIEEAAGIAKHRRRRERAERKLAGLETDLNRLQDLVGELRRQLKPLKQQAELAERYESLNREAAELARKVAAARLRSLNQDRDRRHPAWQKAEERQTEIQSRLSDLDAEIAELEAEREAAEAGLRQVEELHARCIEDRSDAEGRLREAIREEAGAREHMARASNRSGRLFALEEELQRTEKALSEVRASLQCREADLEAGERSFRQTEQARRDAEEDRRRVGEQIAARRAEAEALRRSLTNQDAELERQRPTPGSLSSKRRSSAWTGWRPHSSPSTGGWRKNGRRSSRSCARWSPWSRGCSLARRWSMQGGRSSPNRLGQPSPGGEEITPSGCSGISSRCRRI